MVFQLEWAIMKKFYGTYFFKLLFLLCFTACGSEQGNDVKENISSSTTVAGQSLNTAQTLSQKLNFIFQNTPNNGEFNGIEITSISHPQKLIGSWSMWSGLRGDVSTLRSDGSCEEQLFYYTTGESKTYPCNWYHIQLANNATPFILYIYNNGYYYFSRYQWVDKSNIRLLYQDGSGHLATKVNSSLVAKDISKRWLLGTWVNTTSYNKNTYWSFNLNHQLQIEEYSKNNKLLLKEEGKWNINKRKLTLDINHQSSGSYTLNLNNPERLTDSTSKLYIKRYSEPLVVKNNPYRGTFQAYPTSSSPNAMSINSVRKSSNNYTITIFWNHEIYKNMQGTVKKGLLYIPTSAGTLIFKPVINGLIQVSSLKNKAYNLYGRVLKVSDTPTLNSKNIVGRWISGEYQRTNAFTFFKNGHYLYENGKYGSSIGREGSYKIHGNKITFTPICGKKYTDIFTLNQQHFSPKSYGRSFVKIQKSDAIIKLKNALKDYTFNETKKAYPLKAHPTLAGKFLMQKKQEYDNSGLINILLYNDGKALLTSTTSMLSLSYNYYIESNTQGKETVIITDKSNKNIIKKLSLYEGRETICYDNIVEAYLK